MEIFILIAIPLVVLFIAWYQYENDMNVRKGKSFSNKLDKPIKVVKQNKLTKEEKKKLSKQLRQGKPNNNNSIKPIKTVQNYEYPEATRQLKERLDDRIKAEQEDKDKNKTYKGKRGGRYTKDKTKDGRPYRRYF